MPADQAQRDKLLGDYRWTLGKPTGLPLRWTATRIRRFSPQDVQNGDHVPDIRFRDEETPPLPEGSIVVIHLLPG